MIITDYYKFDVKYYYCDVSGRTYKSKWEGDLTIHIPDVHGIDVKFYYCDVSECHYITKWPNNLELHKVKQHNTIIRKQLSKNDQLIVYLKMKIMNYLMFLF